jgi:hypothetical protein
MKIDIDEESCERITIDTLKRWKEIAKPILPNDDDQLYYEKLKIAIDTVLEYFIV